MTAPNPMYVSANSHQIHLDLIQGATAILSILDKVEQLTKETPPVENAASRFGNPAFRTFYDKVSDVCEIGTMRITY
jgi:hypothetical protein